MVNFALLVQSPLCAPNSSRMKRTLAVLGTVGKVALVRQRRPIKAAVEIVSWRRGVKAREERRNGGLRAPAGFSHPFFFPSSFFERVQTDTAANRLKELLSTKPDAIGIRLGIKTSEFRGSGWQWKRN